MSEYDIFISYRRDGGAQYARIMQLMLYQRGYNVFLDYDELIDGKFGENIKKAIKDAPIFMLILSKGSMTRCKNENDWMRQEIQLAISLGKQIIPIIPDNSFDGIPTDIPDDIRLGVGMHQYSEVNFGQTLGITVDYLIEKRIVPYIGKRACSGKLDNSFISASKTLKRISGRNHKIILAFFSCLVFAIIYGCAFFLRKTSVEKNALLEIKALVENKHEMFGLKFSQKASVIQINAVDRILDRMVEVSEGLLWMSQFECSVSDWFDIVGGEYDKSISAMPMTNISFGECLMVYIDSLRALTKINFDLPSAEEWEYAANGGCHPDNTMYSGSNDVDKVAWYKDNSQGNVHPSDGQQGKSPNNIDLFDMSGNVCEMCCTPFQSQNGEILWTVCGGSVNTPAEGVMVSSRYGIDADSRNFTTGFRLVIRKD